MTTILITFVLALCMSILLTPRAGSLGIACGAMDIPSARKVHNTPIPRTGGLGIFLSFFLSIVAAWVLATNISKLLYWDQKIAFVTLGAMVCFGVGLFDDFKKLGPAVKVLFQILAASLAFWGGLQIVHIESFIVNWQFGIFSYFVTVFWFLLVINAVNLIDGLDGLAGGIAVFASVVMVILSIINEDYLTGIFFAALGGAVLGFLRYNFNPATIFLGDGGSYFIGYAIAALSIMGSVKSQVSVAMMIPALALGVPLFDTVLSPLRRWVRGQKMFSPDNGHIHHRLLSRGLSARKAVVIIYGITAVLCAAALLLVNVRDERAGLFLIVLGAGAVIFVRKLGYFEYVGSEKIFGWFKDVTDEVGISRGRRTFLSAQIDIAKAENAELMWEEAATALSMLDFDYAGFYGNGHSHAGAKSDGQPWPHVERRGASIYDSTVCDRKTPPDWEWKNLGFARDEERLGHRLMKIELPLVSEDCKNFGTMVLMKNVETRMLSHYALRRVEHLRRTLVQALGKHGNGRACDVRESKVA